MLTLWYIILGWKEYNKPFRKVEQPAKPVDSVKKPDLIPLKKDVPPTKTTDIKNPEPPSSTAPRPPLPSAFNSKNHEQPRLTDIPKTPETPKVEPKAPETPKVEPKVPETPRVVPKAPETPKIVPKAPETPKVEPKTPEVPKVESKTPEPPKLPLRTSEPPKVPDLRLAPEPPKTTEGLKFPDSLPQTLPSRSPDASLPNFPASGRNPAHVPPSPQSEFPLPPYLPGPPQSKPVSRDDELFSVGSAFSNPKGPDRPPTNLRDLSYAKGEFPREEVEAKVKDMMSRVPKYMEQSVISNPDSLESDEEDEDF